MNFIKMNTAIREYRDSDHENCLRAFKTNVPQFFVEPEITLFENWLRNLDEPNVNGKTFSKRYYYVILLDEAVVGCGGFAYNEATNEATLAWGLIEKDYHKSGLGKALLVYRLQQIKTLHPGCAVVVDTTQHAYSFFEHYGFVVEKITADFYAPGMHRYDMRLKL